MAKKKSFRKLLAAAFALTLVGGLGAAGAANAATDAPWDAANATKTGSINIYKMKDGAAAAAGKTHSQMNPSDVTTENAVPGAEFTVTPVTQVKVGNDKKDVNLKTFEGWKDISKVISDLNKNTEDTTLYTLDAANAKKGTTGTDGKVAFTPLNIGLYKVVETKVPAGYTGTTTFFMTIPQVTGSDSTNAKYNYNVNVFPKNTDAVTGALGKTLDDGSFVGAGDTAKYTITAATNTIATKGGTPAAWTAADFTDYAVFDDAPNAAYSDIAEAAVKEVKVGDTKLEAADYAVSTIAAESASDKFSKGLATDHTRIIVKFNTSGLEKIAAAKNTDSDVRVSMNVSLTLKADLPGTVTNNAGYVPGYNPTTPGVTPPGPVTPPTPTPDNPTPPGTVETKFGEFKIKKVAAENNATPLENAEFLAFAKEGDAKDCAADTGRTAGKCKDKASAIELKSQADGLTTAKKVKLGKKFWVVETKAPAKYVLSGEVTEVTADENSATTKPIVIENVLSSDSGTWFNLPKTGAIGVGIFALLGAGLVAGGTAMHLRSRGREDA